MKFTGEGRGGGKGRQCLAALLQKPEGKCPMGKGNVIDSWKGNCTCVRAGTFKRGGNDVFRRAERVSMDSRLGGEEKEGGGQQKRKSTNERRPVARTPKKANRWN